MGSAKVRLTEDARGELRPGEALVFDWHRLAICWAAAGEVSLQRAYPHLAAHDIEVDCCWRLGLHHFTSSLPPDFGLRSILGRPNADPVSGGAK